ncbi:MAG: AraC family transcriptional regulator [Alphaproteobacteria bacterium]|nr:AraC family transcriptional regulator [Alphaproteobacteria bacterium]
MDDSLSVTVRRDASADYAWEMAETAVPPALAGLATRLVGYREWMAQPLRRIEPPYTGLPLIIGFGETLNVSGERYRLDDVSAFVAGLDLSAAYTEGSGHHAGVQLDLTPLGAVRILGMPLADLAYGLVKLEELLGREGATLRQRLGEANDWASRLRLVRDFAQQRAAAHAGAPWIVAYAWQALTRSHGAANIARLADDAGVSRKHLTQQFRAWTGLPPSAYARLVRFERAVKEIERAPLATDWAQIAAGCGYYDQPHFNRDFKAFTGLSPTAFVARIIPNGGVAA